ncbi:unnamed protein product, partial [Timema podura]|nr:unnamed protein product [Timema podura]
ACVPVVFSWCKHILGFEMLTQTLCAEQVSCQQEVFSVFSLYYHWQEVQVRLSVNRLPDVAMVLITNLYRAAMRLTNTAFCEDSSTEKMYKCWTLLFLGCLQVMANFSGVAWRVSMKNRVSITFERYL